MSIRSLPLGAFALAALVSLCADPVQAQSLRAPIELAPGLAGQLSRPVLATRGDRSAAMFQRSGPLGERELWFAGSDGRGTVWQPPVLLDSWNFGLATLAAFGRHNENLAVRGDVVHALWAREASTGEAVDLYYRRSLDGGVTWDPALRVDSGQPVSGEVLHDWVLAVAGNRVHVLLHKSAVGLAGRSIVMSSSSDGGATFGSAVSVSPWNGFGAFVHQIGLEADGADVHVVWNDDHATPNEFDVYHARSTDGGQSFGAPQQLDGSPSGAGDARDYLTISIDGPELFATWTERRAHPLDRELFGVLSLDGGASFGADFPIRVPGPWTPDVAWSRGVVANGVLHAVWGDDRGGVRDAYVARSLDQGQSWSETRLSFLTGMINARLVIDAEDRAKPTLVVGYTTPSPLLGQSVVALSRDAGATWQNQIVASTTGGDVNDAVVTWNGRYGNVLTAFAWKPWSGATDYRAFAGGFRPQGLSFSNLVSGGSAQVQLTGWEPTSAPRFVWVLASGGLASLPLPNDGRDLGLVIDGTFRATLADAATFLTTLDVAGSGTTSAFPLAVPPGTGFFATAVSFELGATSFAELADVVRFTVQ